MHAAERWQQVCVCVCVCVCACACACVRACVRACVHMHAYTKSVKDCCNLGSYLHSQMQGRHTSVSAEIHIGLALREQDIQIVQILFLAFGDVGMNGVIALQVLAVRVVKVFIEELH